jgi:protein phosphatase
MKIELPSPSLVLLIGASGSGKSTFAARHFLPTEVVSSDHCRGLVCDDSNNQEATTDAFALLHHLLEIRLRRRRLTVVDATNVNPADRAKLVALARRFHILPAAVIFDIPEQICQQRNSARPDRQFGPHVVRNHLRQLKRGMKGLKREGFRKIHVFHGPEEVEACEGILRQPLWNDRRDDHGPFDFIGDVHGCLPELLDLLGQLGYAVDEDGVARHPDGRRLVFVGDLVDRGPDSPGVLRLVMASVAAGTALCVPGNHDDKLLRFLKGKNVKLTHGLDRTVEQLAGCDDDFKQAVAIFIDSLVSHYVLDDGKVVVAHAGLKEEMHGGASGAVREFCLYGETTGETDEFGLPERLDWAASYHGQALVVYGHTPFEKPRWRNMTVNIDTGCAFGGALTALRYPEKETVSIPARESYATPARPLRSEEETTPDDAGGVDGLDIASLTGKLILHTTHAPTVIVPEENTMAALEVMSRFAIDPRWLIHLPPTMSPCATSPREGWLERPEEAFSYYSENEVFHVVCEEKHMGSRAIVVVARDAARAARVFGTDDGKSGVVFTRTGRAFFPEPTWEAEVVATVARAMEDSGLWDELATDWVCLDTELMPWSAKARELLVSQYAPVASAGQAYHEGLLRWLDRMPDHDPHIAGLRARSADSARAILAYRDAYRRYCWPVISTADLRLAVFHVLASEGAVHDHQPHHWHMALASRLSEAGAPLLMATRWLEVDLSDPEAVSGAVAWWEELTAVGGEGMVVKPSTFLAHGPKGLLQPAIKCRGKDYLRIIYGPDYDAPANLERLRQRNLGAKRSLAHREFSLGLEALHRFVDKRPLREIHPLVFAILALESTPVDPRL